MCAACGSGSRGIRSVLAALEAEHTPLRLPLGDDAVDALVGHLDSVRAEMAVWEKTARSTGFDA